MSTGEPYAAIVTGGSGGIGREIVRRLLDAGYHVTSLDRRAPSDTHSRLHTIEVDLFDAAATAEAAWIAAARMPVTHVVHNAGVIRPNLLPEVAVEDLTALTQLHLGAALLLVQAALPSMTERRFGRVVLISSRAILGAATRTAYAATKAGMLGMARTWALELAQKGVTVNVVAPGPVRTAMFHDVIPEGSPKVAQMAATIPVGRLGEPEDVANAVMFFAAPEASFVTGQTLFVCGGLSLASMPA
jgi:NAD(P)-dependent dehydrogenase (short-subunit alcohol dehydrogenase family)